jgi:hypothetical protein
MRNKLMPYVFAVLILFGATLSTGCMAHTHVVGTGAQTGMTDEARQWYVLWGLVPINDVDSNQMATGSQNYTVETEITPLDFVINIFTSFITVYSRTVTVTK